MSTFNSFKALLDEVDARVAAAEQERDRLRTELALAASGITELRGRITALEGAIAQLQAEKRTLEAAATTLRTEKGALEATVAELRAEKAALEDSARTLRAEVATLRARIAELETQHPLPEPDEGLFFKQAARPADGTLVLAHYFPVFPLSIENADPKTDYYARNWLSLSGGSETQHAAYGGRLRDRPLTNAPYTGDWRRAAAAEELRAAVKYGLDGFFVNLMSTSHEKTYNALRDEAAANFPNVKIVPMVDTNGSLDNDQAKVVAVVASFITTPNALVLPNGKYAVASFKAEGRDAAWWQQLAADVKVKSGRDVDFIHVYNSGNIGSLPQYAAGVWGSGTDPVTVRSWSGTKAQADSRGIGHLHPVWASDARVANGIADEPLGFEGLRASWDKAIASDPFCIQVCTWDDFTEASQFKPSAMRGTALLEYSAYRIAELRSGAKPEILQDAVFVAHRNQTIGAQVTGGQTKLMEQWRAPRAGRSSNVTDGFQDKVQILTFLTKPQRVTVNVGGQASTYDAPAGEHSHFVNARAGEVKVSVGAIEFTSPITIRSRTTNQDRAYAYSSTLGTAPRQYDPTPTA